MSDAMEEFPAWLAQGRSAALSEAERVIDVLCPRRHLVAVVWLIDNKRVIEMAFPVTYSGTDGGRHLLESGEPPRVLWELRPFDATRLRSRLTGEPILHCGRCRLDLSLDRPRILGAA